MTAVIQIKRSQTAAAQPASLAFGELGINITDKKIYIGNSSGATTLLIDGNATGGSTSTETIQDAAASLFTSGTHVGISVSYPDTNNAINLRNTGVLSFNTRTGAVSLTSSDVTTALGFTPISGVSTETIQDAAASLFTSGTHTGISVSYPDTNNAINLTNTGVLSFNSRTGAVSLTSSDVTTALGYTPQQYDADLAAIASLAPVDGVLVKTGTNGWAIEQLNFDDLDDVTITSAANNDLLKYNSSTSQWVNSTIDSLDIVTNSTNGVFKPLSGGTGDNLKYLHCSYCTGGTASASAATNTLVYYLPFTIGGPGNISVKAAVQSTGTSVGASPGTITAKIYSASSSTGNPSGSYLYDLGTITLTNTISAAFIGDTTVSLPPGHYWVGYKFSAAAVLRRIQIEQGASYRTAGGEVRSGTNYIFHCLTETVTSGSTAPNTVGSLTEVNSTSLNTTVPSIYLQIQ